jgi:hypothetical protein
MDPDECVGILSQVKSHYHIWIFKEKTAQGIMILQLIPVSSERDLAQMERDRVERERDRVQREGELRTLHALRAKTRQLRRLK